MKAWLADVTKWIILIAVAAIAFYLVYPKYYFKESKLTESEKSYLHINAKYHTGVMRYNQVTGKGVLVVTDCKDNRIYDN